MDVAIGGPSSTTPCRWQGWRLRPSPRLGPAGKGWVGKRAEKFPRVVIDGATALVVADIKAPRQEPQRIAASR